MTKQNLAELAKSGEMQKRRQALTDPVRFQILGMLHRSERGLTAKELAGRIGKETNRLYYHLRILEDAGLVESNETRPGDRMLEKVYVATDPGRFIWDIEDPVEMSDYLRAQMEVARLDAERAIYAMAEEARAGNATDMKVSWASNWFALTHKDFDEYCARLQALIKEFRQREAEMGPNEATEQIEVFWLVSGHKPSR
jgi:DNA-binding transcriptional ArsR family regulator